jgi:signal transduction histidine kinase/CheY-like chemotaxis protein
MRRFPLIRTIRNKWTTVSSAANNNPALGVSILTLAAVYYMASKLGFTMAYEAEPVAVVWPPTGIALGAVLLFGTRIWPGIMLGAFLANITPNEPLLTACGIATGNTLEALTGAWVLRSFAGFDNAMKRVKDILTLAIGSAFVSTMIGATIGVASLCFGGVHSWSNYGSLWRLWWLGDVTGVLLFVPPLLAWSRWPRAILSLQRLSELLFLLSGVTLVSAVIFSGSVTLDIITRHAFVYLIFPFIIWSAVRFGHKVTTLVTLSASIIATAATLHWLGPFAFGSSEQSLEMLQIFLIALTLTGLILSAAILERRSAEQTLEDADHRKDEFLATLAHELRNSLAPLSNALHILQAPTVDTIRRAESYKIMERQFRQFARQVEDLVDVSRVSHGKITLHIERITLNDAVSAAIETARPLIEIKQQKLSVQLPSEPFWLDADLTRVAQIFSNLLHNAAKYTEPNGQIWLETERQQNAICVRIRDTGIGIPRDVLPHIFEMFMQADTSIERAHGGLGIGLALVKKFVDLHGGHVEAESKGAGFGSTFSVWLPQAQSEMTQHAFAIEKNRVGSSPAPAKLRVLVVDDDPTLAQTLGWMVETLGHEMRLAHSGTVALTIAKLFQPHVILLDIGLPGMSGYKVCENMRADPALKGCTIVAQTGWSQTGHREQSELSGFDYHLVKPISLGALEEVFQSLDPAISA